MINNRASKEQLAVKKTNIFFPWKIIFKLLITCAMKTMII